MSCSDYATVRTTRSSPSDGGHGLSVSEVAAAHLRAMLDALDALDAAVMLFDAEARLIAFNREAEERTRRNFGVRLTPGARLPVRSAIDAEIDAAIAGQPTRVIHGPEQRPAHVAPYWVEVSITPVRDASGASIGAVYHSLDITDRVRARDSLARSNAFREALLALTAAALTKPTDADPFQHVLALCVHHVPNAQAGTVLLADGEDTFRFVAAVGYDLSALLSHAVPADAVTPAHGADAQHPRLRFEAIDDAGTAEALRSLLCVADVRDSLSIPITLDDRTLGFVQLDAIEEGATFGPEAHELAGVVSELLSALVGRLELESLVREERARNEHLVRHDALTGLASRVLLLDRLHRVLVRGRRTRVLTAVIRIDLDGFAAINEAYGHKLGDALLVHVARVLEGLVRETDSVARIGNDEFAVVVAGVADVSTIDTIARRVQAALHAPVTLSGSTLETTCCVGIAVAPDDADDADALFGHAGLAIGRAKREGRGILAYYAAAVDKDARKRHRLGDDLRRALRTGSGIWVAFQPKLHIGARERVVGVEALARWNHPTSGAVPPDVFVHLAEDLGLISRLSMHVYDQACAALARWRRCGIGLGWRMAMNVSPRQLSDGGLEDALDLVLAKHGLGFGDIELEVTESMAFESDTDAVETLRHLRERGARIAIDDFGTGFASLQRLAVQPLDTLKIDRRFVAGLPSSTRDAAVVDTVVALAKGLGLESVAEGVETPEQFEALRRRGVDVAQGYLIAAPMPADQVESWIAHRSSTN